MIYIQWTLVKQIVLHNVGLVSPVWLCNPLDYNPSGPLSMGFSRQEYSKGPYSQSYGFSSSHVWMWELDPKEGWSAEELTFLNCGAGEDS